MNICLWIELSMLVGRLSLCRYAHDWVIDRIICLLKERSNFADVLGFVVKVCQREARLLVNYKMSQYFWNIETFDEVHNDEIMLEIVLRQLARIVQDKTSPLSAHFSDQAVVFLFCLFACDNFCEPRALTWHPRPECPHLIELFLLLQ